MERRREQTESLLQCKEKHDWHGCSENLFRVLYGLPRNTQLGLATFMIDRYLPLFERTWPTITWPAELLGNVDDWLIRHGRDVPEEPADADPADAAFAFAFDALLLASQHKSDALILTASCAAAVVSAIGARQCRVWIADDPQGVDLWREQGYFPGRSLGESRPAIAVSAREWEVVAGWLSTEEVWQHADTSTSEEVESGLARWNDHEMRLILPHDTSY